eukprot:TRINITY_DN18583_c0_g1_i1.p1 TRINITY_DN18583_c0_g1~~TRINITY_DN18583_c0_g1_i1.p1  ORF type:complete len:467 (+),score=129.03 TRINITY_DN18583_c0_g1_i1:45-1445(+)
MCVVDPGGVSVFGGRVMASKPDAECTSNDPNASFHSMAEWSGEGELRTPAELPMEPQPFVASATEELQELPLAVTPPEGKNALPPRAAAQAHQYTPLPDDFGKAFAKRLRATDDFTYTGGTYNSWSIAQESVLSRLEKGAALFGFACKQGTQLSQEERAMCNLIINKSAFDDEVEACRVPKIDCSNLTPDQKGMTFLLVRSVYLAPNVHPDVINLDRFVTPEYHRACQPDGTKVWSDCVAKGDLNTFRITKPIIPLIFKMTVQFRCSEIKKADLPAISQLWGGVRVDRGILLERTKRDLSKGDMTKKCKSLILYHGLPDNRGTVVSVMSFIVNSQLPRVVASLLDKVGSMGTAECIETASKTRRYLGRLQERLLAEGHRFAPVPAALAPSHLSTSSQGSQGLTSSTTPSPSVSLNGAEHDVPDMSAAAPTASVPAPREVRRPSARTVRRIRPPGCTDPRMYSTRTL